MNDWLTMQDIAEMFNVKKAEVENAVRPLRRAGVIRTTLNPRDERQVLIFREDLDYIRKALLVDGADATA